MHTSLTKPLGSIDPSIDILLTALLVALVADAEDEDVKSVPVDVVRLVWNELGTVDVGEDDEAVMVGVTDADKVVVPMTPFVKEEVEPVDEGDRELVSDATA